MSTVMKHKVFNNNNYILSNTMRFSRIDRVTQS